MKYFKYSGKNRSNESVKGFITAKTRREAFSKVKNLGYTQISLTATTAAAVPKVKSL